MKKVSVLLLSVMFLFTSCSSDDDNSQIDLSVDITGQWDLTEVESEGDSTVTYEGQTVTVTLSGFGKDYDAQVLFTENPNQVSATGTYTMVLTTTFLGITQTDEYPIEFSNEFESGNWSLEGNQMLITDITTGETQAAEILVLQQNKMVLLLEMTTMIEGVEANLTSEMTLER